VPALGLQRSISRRGFLRVGLATGIGGTLAVATLTTTAAAQTTAPAVVSPTKKAYLGCSLRSFDLPAHVDWNKGAMQFAQKVGLSDRYDVSLCEGDSQKQFQQVQAFIAKTGKDGVLAFDPNLTAGDTAAIVKLCEDAGVYCWNFALKGPDQHPSDYTHWVSFGAFDFVTQGKLEAQELFKAMGGSGAIVALLGPVGHPAGNDRRAGLGLALQENPNIRLLAQENVDDWDQTKALNVMQDLLVAQPELQGVWAANDSVALGALEALRNAGKAGQIPLTGVDASDATVQAVINGEMTATMSQEMTRTGFYGLDIAWQAYMGNIDPATLPAEHREFEIANRTVNRDNAQDYYNNFSQNTPDYNVDDYWSWAVGLLKPETYDPSLIAAP
jgi:ribose transport system substrate-binding protein